MKQSAKLSVVFILTILTGCSGFREPAQERAHRAKKAKGDIIIGIAWPFSVEKDKFREGIQLAVDEINSAGGVLDRKIRLIQEDDEASINRGTSIAQKFAENLDMVAVIGHCNSYISIPTSATYESAGLLMLSPGSTNPKLTLQGFKHVFRSIPNDKQIGRQLADYGKRRGYKKFVIYYAKNTYGRGLANSFENRAEELGLIIVDRLPFTTGSAREFQQVLSNWKSLDFDAIFLAATMPAAAKFVLEARRMGFKVPIIGGDGLDSPELLRICGKAAEGTVAASVFHVNNPRDEVQAFNKTFEEKYGCLPDMSAVQGYDALRLLVHAMETAGSTVPDKMAEALRSTKDWDGVTGSYSFDKNGDIAGQAIVKKIVRNGRFEYLGE